MRLNKIRTAIALILIGIICGCWFVLVLTRNAALKAANKFDCMNNMHGLFISTLQINQRGHYELPYFGNWDETTEFWSWRTTWLQQIDEKTYRRVRFTEPWNSDYNLPLIENIANKKYFTCPGDFPREQRATYVAVTGPGTAWAELRKGPVRNLRELSDMILFIETSEPKDHWAEPGDDVSPEEVVRMFESDPGLVKNSKQDVFSKGHYPKHFVTAIGTCHSFGEISDVEELKRRLLISPKTEPVQNEPPISLPFCLGSSAALRIRLLMSAR